MEACFHALVDFDHWLGCGGTPSSLRDQVLLTEQLSVLSGGYVLPLVPYNPWTDIVTSGKSLRLVEEAIEERGFVGVKIYPPMGYRPLGTPPQADSALPRPNMEKLGQCLRELYAWCEKRGVPVMGHADHSMGRDPPHDDLSNPFGWAEALRTIPGLRVNVGHFGGNLAAGRDWAGDFVKLMGLSEGANLYADLGIRVDLLERQSADAMHMAKLLAGVLGPDQRGPVYRRVMYGSDWLMLSRMSNWADFAGEIAHFIGSISGVDHAAALRAVFYENAADCFGLRRNGQNRIRLERFYARWKVAAPSWMTKLDRLG